MPMRSCQVYIALSHLSLSFWYLGLNRFFQSITVDCEAQFTFFISITLSSWLLLSRYYLITELAAGGDLMDYICYRKKLGEVEVRKFIRQTVSAVHYLHQGGILHRYLITGSWAESPSMLKLLHLLWNQIDCHSNSFQLYSFCLSDLNWMYISENYNTKFMK